jgi:hypothetical protein
MDGLDRWDVLVLIAAGYLAVMALVRMMAARRSELVGRIRAQGKRRKPTQKKDNQNDAGSKAA